MIKAELDEWLEFAVVLYKRLNTCRLCAEWKSSLQCTLHAIKWE